MTILSVLRTKVLGSLKTMDYLMNFFGFVKKETKLIKVVKSELPLSKNPKPVISGLNSENHQLCPVKSRIRKIMMLKPKVGT